MTDKIKNKIEQLLNQKIEELKKSYQKHIENDEDEEFNDDYWYLSPIGDNEVKSINSVNVVDVKIAVDKLDCKNKDWNDAFAKIERLKVYTSLRKDPQAKAVEDLESALKKAQASSNEKFCESVVKINRARVDVITDAWRGR